MIICFISFWKEFITWSQYFFDCYHDGRNFRKSFESHVSKKSALYAGYNKASFVFLLLGLFGPVCSFCDLLLRSSAVCRGFLTLLGLDAFQNPASAKSSVTTAQAVCGLQFLWMYSLLPRSIHKAWKWHSDDTDEMTKSIILFFFGKRELNERFSWELIHCLLHVIKLFKHVFHKICLYMQCNPLKAI